MGKLENTDAEKRRGGLAGKVRGAWEEARAMGLRGAVGAARSDPERTARSALEQLEQEHRLQRAELGRSQAVGAGTVEEDVAREYEHQMTGVKGEARSDAATERQWVQDAFQAMHRPETVQMPTRTPELDRGVSFER
ncbi:MAG: hypothetical protein J4F34_05450 [Gemmatimonadetes bacterium]|nr:hypothetical protein [Gemmatimonadota bacterium]